MNIYVSYQLTFIIIHSADTFDVYMILGLTTGYGVYVCDHCTHNTNFLALFFRQQGDNTEFKVVIQFVPIKLDFNVNVKATS